MHGGNVLSFTKVLTGISKGLGIVNQAIPIYKEIKPMVRNAKKVFEIAKEFNKTSPNKVLNNTYKKKEAKDATLNIEDFPKPSFFQ